MSAENTVNTTLYDLIEEMGELKALLDDFKMYKFGKDCDYKSNQLNDPGNDNN